jgi:16S rRNA processing protein RimM
MNENGFRFKSAKTAILNFKWVDSENYAKRLIGQNVFLLKNEIIPNEEEVGPLNLENYFLFDDKLGKLGKIEKIDDYSGNIVFTIQYKNSELLIPFHEEILVSMNHVLKQITLKIPAGLI